MPRASWKGFIRLSLVSIPVQGFSASASGGGEVHLHQLHAACNSRIRYQKICPLHGEVSNDEIVKGYEYANGQYAIVDTDELEKLRSERDRSINIDHFFQPSEIDPRYYSGKTYYLTPDGPAGQKPYALLHRAMSEDGVYSIGQVVLTGKEELVVLRPIDKLLVLSTLEYASHLKDPAAFDEEIGEVQLTAKELELTHSLLAATTTERLDLRQYRDLYTERLTRLIQMKVEGREVVESPEEEQAPVINLMDALKASIARVKAAEPASKPAAGRSATKRAASRVRGGSRTRRKTG